MKNFFILCVLFAGSWNVCAQSPEARFLEVRGRVEVKEPGSPDWRAAVPGLRIGRNTVISTGLKSSAVISAGSSRLEVRPLTMLTLTELTRRGDAEEASLYLRTGRVRAAVTPPTGQSVDFTVGSPTVTASVRGTSFEFDGRRIQVENGRVLLAGFGGQKVYVARAQRSHADVKGRSRIVPPFEAEAALLRPVIPELDDTGGGARPPVMGPETQAAGVGVTVGWR